MGPELTGTVCDIQFFAEDVITGTWLIAKGVVIVIFKGQGKLIHVFLKVVENDVIWLFTIMIWRPNDVKFFATINDCQAVRTSELGGSQPVPLELLRLVG